IAGNLIKTGDLKINVPTASLAIHGVAVPAEVTANSSFAKFSLLGQPVDETTGSGSSDAPNIVYFLYDHFTGGAIGSIDRGSSSVIVKHTEANSLQVIQEIKTAYDLQLEQVTSQQLFHMASLAQLNATTLNCSPTVRAVGSSTSDLFSTP